MSFSGIDIVHEYSIDGSNYIDHGFVVLKDSSGTTRVPLNDLQGFKGVKTVEELEYLAGMSVNDVYAVSDSGTLVNPDGTALVIVKGDLVQYDGTKWVLMIRLTNYVSFEKFKDTVEMLTAAIASAFAAEHAYTREHREDFNNPHRVTAEQVGAESAEDALRIDPSYHESHVLRFYRRNNYPYPNEQV